MSALSARSASALLSPAPSAMLSTSSDLFTLASEMFACSRKLNAFTTIRQAFPRRAMHARMRATLGQRTTARVQSGGYRVVARVCMRARLARVSARARDAKRDAGAMQCGRRATTTRPHAEKPGREAGLLLQPRADSNCRYRLERAASSATRRRGQTSCEALLLRARGGGLEPPTTGPEPVVLPITPPPKVRSE